MEIKKAAITAAKQTSAKVQQEKDIAKVLRYFRYTVGTTLDAMLATGILRNSITYYVRDLEEMGELQAIFIGRDRNTGYMAKHYSADKTKWKKPQHQELDLFGKEACYGI